jgi:hypothetical protein
LNVKFECFTFTNGTDVVDPNRCRTLVDRRIVDNLHGTTPVVQEISFTRSITRSQSFSFENSFRFANSTSLSTSGGFEAFGCSAQIEFSLNQEVSSSTSVSNVSSSSTTEVLSTSISVTTAPHTKKTVSRTLDIAENAPFPFIATVILGVYFDPNQLDESAENILEIWRANDPSFCQQYDPVLINGKVTAQINGIMKGSFKLDDYTSVLDELYPNVQDEESQQ